MIPTYLSVTYDWCANFSKLATPRAALRMEPHVARPTAPRTIPLECRINYSTLKSRRRTCFETIFWKRQNVVTKEVDYSGVKKNYCAFFVIFDKIL